MKSAKILVLIAVLLIPGLNIYAGPLPDTGQTKCYNNTVEIPCPSPGEAFYGQDAQYQGPVRSYTKLGQNGVLLADTATQESGWLMTRDNVTGLIWEMKTDDNSIHDKDNTYTWANAQSMFIATLNQQNFGGYSDWRLPTRAEFQSAIQGATLPTLSVGTYLYWTSEKQGNRAWAVTIATDANGSVIPSQSGGTSLILQTSFVHAIATRP